MKSSVFPRSNEGGTGLECGSGKTLRLSYGETWIKVSDNKRWAYPDNDP